MFFTPRYKKRGKLLLKGVKKFLHYKNDVIPEAKLDEIHKLRDEFKEALVENDAEKVKELTPKLTRVCEKSVPSQTMPGLRENIEVIFVAVVIAVGIRAYFLQPFKIPTGSMQVTLNGVLAYPGEDEQPGMMTRIWERVARGRSYVDIKSPHTGTLAIKPDGQLDMEETNLLLFTKTKLRFQDGFEMTLPIPKDRVLQMGLGKALGMSTDDQGRWGFSGFRRQMPVIKEGDTLVQGYIESGDQVLVDKVSYHFRSPKRGEVFVFNTRGIRMIEGGNRFRREWGSQHYIKRLVGLPGDLIEVKAPKLHVNGEEAQEPGIRRVWEEMAPDGGYGGYTYSTINRIHLVPNEENVGRWPVAKDQDLYWAMGDNSANSSDSRSWGPVPESNVVGPALFVYWPFAQHWGVIR